jgi:hypothetical protein
MTLYEEWLGTDGGKDMSSDQKAELKVRLIVLYEEAEKHKTMSDSHYIYWASLVEDEQIQNILKRGLQTHHHSTILWLEYVKTIIDKDEKQLAFMQAMAHIKEADIWTIRKSYIECLMDDPRPIAYEKIASELSTASLDARYGNEAMLMYLNWEYSQTGLLGARKVCREFLKDRVTVEVLKAWIDLEIKQQPSFDKEQIRYGFEKILQKETSNSQFWLEYMAWELDMKEFEKAQHLYWKALKLVPDPEVVTTHYRRLL